MSKDDFLFAAPSRIEASMLVFEKNFLSRYTPCHCSDIIKLADALGIIHVELIVIHPFRDGNGRTARLLADLMVMQAQRPPLDFNYINRTKNEEGFKQYITAIHAGVRGNYKPMEKIFLALLG